MGGQNVELVMKALDGADVSIDNWKPRKKDKELRRIPVRCLDTYDFALLLTIAYRQQDEDGTVPPADCLCYGGEARLAGIARMGTTKLEDCRDFLLATNLISYKKTEKCPEYLRDSIEKKYHRKIDVLDYVWRINKPVLELMKRRRKSGKSDKSPSCGEDEPATRGDKARHAGTKNTYKTTLKSSMSSDVDNKKEEDKKRAEGYIQYIAAKYTLTPEQQEIIGIEGVVAGTANKMPDAVIGAINSFGHRDMLDNSKKFGTWIGMLIKALKSVPEADDPTAIPSADDIAAQFAPPELEPTPREATKREAESAVNDGWDKLVNGLALEELDEAKRDEFKRTLESKMGAYVFDEWPQRVENLINRIKRENGGSFEALRTANPEVESRAKILQDCLEKEGK